ncbi:MAG: hypothetical protein R3180_00290 [Marinobacter sp.]|nr:hypothetical protein [Marinobacter sp.]
MDGGNDRLSNEERIAAIRRESRRQQAERQQRELAESRARSSQQRTTPVFGWGHLAALVVVVFGAIYVYTGNDQADDQEDVWQLGRDIQASQLKAAQQAGLHYLAEQGVDISTVTNIRADELDGGRLYRITVDTPAGARSLTARLTCQDRELNLTDRMQAACYRWR